MVYSYIKELLLLLFSVPFTLVELVYRRVVSEEVLAGTELPGGGGRGRLYLTLYCLHQNDFCIQMGSDESHLNVSLIVRGTKTVFINHNF